MKVFPEENTKETVTYLLTHAHTQTNNIWNSRIRLLFSHYFLLHINAEGNILDKLLVTAKYLSRRNIALRLFYRFREGVHTPKMALMSEFHCFGSFSIRTQTKPAKCEHVKLHGIAQTPVGKNSRKRTLPAMVQCCEPICNSPAVMRTAAPMYRQWKIFECRISKYFMLRYFSLPQVFPHV